MTHAPNDRVMYLGGESDCAPNYGQILTVIRPIYYPDGTVQKYLVTSLDGQHNYSVYPFEIISNE
jgi:hypothetical protein